MVVMVPCSYHDNMTQYFYNPYDLVLQGPQDLPPDIAALPEFMRISTRWYEFVDTGIPTYTPIKQQPVLLDYKIIDNKVYPNWIIQDIPEEMQANILAMVEQKKSTTIVKVNNTIGTIRSKYITATVGQDLTYQQKMFEVQRYDIDTNPTGSNYPYLQAEATATNSTLQDIYTLVKTTATQWNSVGAQLEGIRRGTIVAIQNAADEIQLNKIMQQFNADISKF